MLVLASAFRYGFKPSLLPALGIASANVLWLILGVSGAAVLAETYPAGFLALKLIGLLVISYLGLRTILGPLPSFDVNETRAPKRGLLYAKGFALQISSPMPLVYFGAMLPAFVNAQAPLAPQFLIMLVTVTITELVGLAVYAYGAQSIRGWLKSARAARGFNIVIGAVMILSGVWAVLSTTAF
jgi:homoserine/homoserine lactone efflux protein